MSAGAGSDTVDLRAALRETARKFLADRSSPAVVRAIGDGRDDGSELWREVVGLGWTGVEVPELDGGLGAGFAELVVLLEECGRAVSPVPLLGAVVLGGGSLLASVDDEIRATWLGRIASGEVLVTAALCGATGVPDSIDVVVRQDAGAWILDGVSAFVPDAALADAIVIATRDASGATHVHIVERGAPGLNVVPQPTIDRTRHVARVELSAVRSAGRMGGAEVAQALADRAALGVAADCVGGADRVLEITIEYLAARRQFGRALGTFQALKHRCADAFLLVTGASVAVAHAAEVIDRPDERAAAVSIAKSYAGEAYANVASDAVQMHGAIGFTAECDVQLFLKRAKLNEVLFGDADFHRDRLDGLILPPA